MTTKQILAGIAYGIVCMHADKMAEFALDPITSKHVNDGNKRLLKELAAAVKLRKRLLNTALGKKEV